MDHLLTDLFDLQRFAGDRALQAVIDEVEGRYAVRALEDDELGTLSAAGDPYTRALEHLEKDEPQ